MIKIIKYIFNWVFWGLFYQILLNYNYKTIFDSFTTLFSTLPFRTLLKFISDLINNRFSNNNIFRLINLPEGLNVNILFDNSSKRFFWSCFIFFILVHRWLLIFKNLILLPFKWGIYSFIYSLIGFDVNWFLNLFNFFSINIPAWVYLQYLILYNNWLNWWRYTVNVKNLRIMPLPERKSIKLIETEKSESVDSNDITINKKKLIIILGVITLIGVGIWYWYYYNGANNGGGNPTNQNPIEIFNNQTGDVVDPTTLTDAERLELVDRANRLRDAGRITNPEHNDLLNTILSPAPSYEASSNLIETSNTSTAPTNPEYSQFFSENNPVTNDNSTASGSGNRETTVAVEVINDTQGDIPEITVTPASPVESPPTTTERPLSPTGSTDSSETIRPFTYRGPNESARYAIPRRPFDPVYRNNNN